MSFHTFSGSMNTRSFLNDYPSRSTSMETIPLCDNAQWEGLYFDGGEILGGGGAKVDLRWCLPVTCPSTTHPLVSLLSTPLYPPISILKFPRCAGDRLCSFALSSGWAMRKGSTRLGWVDHIQTYATLIPRILVNLTAPSTKYAECRK